MTRDTQAVAEFRERLRQLKPLWERNFLLLFLPGFLLFVVGGPGGLLLPDGQASHNLWLIMPGIALCLTGAVRGAMLMWRYRRCPVCDRFQPPQFRIPYRTCLGCGVKLTDDWKESA